MPGQRSRSGRRIAGRYLNVAVISARVITSGTTELPTTLMIASTTLPTLPSNWTSKWPAIEAAKERTKSDPSAITSSTSKPLAPEEAAADLLVEDQAERVADGADQGAGGDQQGDQADDAERGRVGGDAIEQRLDVVAAAVVVQWQLPEQVLDRVLALGLVVEDEPGSRREHDRGREDREHPVVGHAGRELGAAMVPHPPGRVRDRLPEAIQDMHGPLAEGGRFRLLMRFLGHRIKLLRPRAQPDPARPARRKRRLSSSGR